MASVIHKDWHKFQDMVKSDVQGKDTLMSGAVPKYKYDVLDKTGILFIECKLRKELKIERKWLEKLRWDTMESTYIPVVAIKTHDMWDNYLVLIDMGIKELVPSFVPDILVTIQCGSNRKSIDMSLCWREHQANCLDWNNPADVGKEIGLYLIGSRYGLKSLAKELRQRKL
jgi:hypothetical protein